VRRRVGESPTQVTARHWPGSALRRELATGRRCVGTRGDAVLMVTGGADREGLGDFRVGANSFAPTTQQAFCACAVGMPFHGNRLKP